MNKGNYRFLYKVRYLKDTIRGGELEELISETMEDILFDFFSANTEDKCKFEDWTEAPNQVVLTKGFSSIFEDPKIAYFVAYWSIQMIFECSGSGTTGYLQPFMFKGIEYWVICEKSCIMVILPEEY